MQVGGTVAAAVTFAGPPQSGAFVVARAARSGVRFPLPNNRRGLSAMVEGRERSEFLDMPDKFGARANSRDFLNRAYYIRLSSRPPAGGRPVAVGDYISFQDTENRMGFAIVNEGTTSRLLTGGDIDPESLQRTRRRSVGGRRVRPLDPSLQLDRCPFRPAVPSQRDRVSEKGVPDGAEPSSRTPCLDGGRRPGASTCTRRSRGPRWPVSDTSRRLVYEFSTEDQAFTGRVLQYRTEAPGNLVADMWAVDTRPSFVVIERDLGSGVNARFRRIYLIDLRVTDPAGFLVKTELVDLTAIPDPDLVSLPELRPGDVGLGDPFSVTCESVEAVHLVTGNRLLVGCDNNLPNSGRNPRESRRQRVHPRGGSRAGERGWRQLTPLQHLRGPGRVHPVGPALGDGLSSSLDAGMSTSALRTASSSTARSSSTPEKGVGAGAPVPRSVPSRCSPECAVRSRTMSMCTSDFPSPIAHARVRPVEASAGECPDSGGLVPRVDRPRVLSDRGT